MEDAPNPALHPDLAGSPSVWRDAKGKVAKLTSRELEILNLSAEGLSSQHIAASLRISKRTVDNHRANLLSKLGAKTMTIAVRLAIYAALAGSESEGCQMSGPEHRGDSSGSSKPARSPVGSPLREGKSCAKRSESPSAANGLGTALGDL